MAKIEKGLKYILIGIVVVLFWRGIDGLMDAYLFPNHQVLSSIASLVIAFVVFYFGNFNFKDLD